MSLYSEEDIHESLHTDTLEEESDSNERYSLRNVAWDPEEVPQEVLPSETVRQGGTPEEVLKKLWGFTEFRPLQREIVQSVLNGQDTFGLMPTGGGKSITFQVPGLILPGLTLVVTPLVSLMKDQVDRLRSMGIKATAIHSGMHHEKIITTIGNCIYGKYKFLYVSPERLSSPLFLAHLTELNVSLLVVDECHCICQWGYDFRPQYLQIKELRKMLPEVPVLALTATATPDAVEDICHHLDFPRPYAPHIFRKSFLRSNLSYSIRRTEDKEAMLLHILHHVSGTTIVYCRNRKLTRDIATMLNAQGISAHSYHAGMTHVERERCQNRWMNGDIRVIVATNAFGMGIDKPDVRLVIHLMMPASLEEYFQEAGRAGRDGQLSYAVALVSHADAGKLKRKINDSFPPMETVYRTFESICNFLQIGEGEGFERSFDFDIELFIRIFKMHPTRTRSVIDILQTAGLWEYHQDESRSRINMIYRREQLYEWQDAQDDMLIRTLLRTYPGIFADYVFMDELVIAQKCGMTPDEVYLLLTRLSKMGVLHYIPKKKLPRLFFHICREDANSLHISPEAYSIRRKRLEERIAAVLQYIDGNEICRSRLLLSYFGENATESCRQCDVCLKHTESRIPHSLLEEVANTLQKLLTHKHPSCSFTEFLNQLPNPSEQAPAALRIVLAENPQYIWDGDSLFLN